MNDKIQKLCKRLNKFTLEEIALIAEIEEPEAKIILTELIKENFLQKQGNTYLCIEITKKGTQINRFPFIFQYHSPDTIDMVIKCFCADISASKTSLSL